MDRSRVGALAVGLAVAITAAAVASYAVGSRHPYAQVLSVKPVHAASAAGRGACIPIDSSFSCPAADYEVRYRLDGRAGVVHMQHDPGGRIPVHDGRLVLDAPPLGSRLF